MIEYIIAIEAGIILGCLAYLCGLYLHQVKELYWELACKLNQYFFELQNPSICPVCREYKKTNTSEKSSVCVRCFHVASNIRKAFAALS